LRFAVVTIAPEQFGHWRAFEEVAETLQAALEVLGHDVVRTQNDFPRDRRSIVLGANLLPVFGGVAPPDQAILFNLEQVADGSPWWNPQYLLLLGRHPVWDYSRANVARLAALGITHAQHVPLGYVPQLTRIAAAPKDIDVLFYGVSTGRRERVLRELRESGIRLEAVNGVYGAGRDALIARARIVLNMHVYPSKLFEIVRVGYLLANRAFVVSELSTEADVEAELAGGFAAASYEGLCVACLQFLVDEPARERIAARGFELFSARRQSDLLMPALARIGAA
jgi:hypothetical protein